MRTTFLIAAAAAALATPALAGPVESFDSLCLDTQGDPVAAITAARAAGWVDDPRMPPGGPMTLLANPAGAGQAIPEALMAGVVPDQDGLNAQACSVIGPMDKDQTMTRLQAILGFAPSTTNTGSKIFVFTRNDGGFQQQTDLTDPGPQELKAAARTRGPLHSIMVQDTAGGPIILHLRVNP